MSITDSKPSTLQTSRKRGTIDSFFKTKKKSKTDEQKEEDSVVQAAVNIPVVVPVVKDTIKSEQSIAPQNQLSVTVDEETLSLLDNELKTMEPSWFHILNDEFTKPYFLELKKYLRSEQLKKKQIFPSPENIYSWTRLTPFDDVRVVIIGQDPYHNFNQAHGLAFSVLKPTVAPPSLKNIYKEIQAHNYSDFVIDKNCGDLSKWSKQGVLLLNTCLTVRAHEAFSHSKRGWEIFTKKIIELLINDRLQKKDKPICFILWGSKAQDLVYKNFKKIDFDREKNFLMLKSVHPSPLSASRGFFGGKQFKKCNEWLAESFHQPVIDWSVVDGTSLQEVQTYNSKLSTN
ncbi:hypothetical protein ACO0QE_000716 [Hanseniaspora vineae]